MITYSKVCRANLSVWTVSEWAHEEPIATDIQSTKLSDGVAIWDAENQQSQRIIYHGPTMSNHV